MAETARLYTVRPLSKPARADLKDALRVYMTPSTLLLHKLKSGDVLILQASKEVPAIVWAATERLQDNIIQISRTLQICCNLSLGDRVAIKKGTRSIEDVKTVFVSFSESISNVQIPLRKQLFEEVLGKAVLLCHHLKFDSVESLGQKQTFQIESLEFDSVSSTDEPAVGRFVPAKTQVRIVPDENDEHTPLMLQDSALGGLDQQVQLLNDIFKAYDRQRPEDSYLFDPAGLLLYGPSGVGKSLLLNAIAKIGWGKAFHIEGASCRRSLTEGIARIRNVFSNAKSSQRGIILVDQLDLLTPNTSDGFSELAVVLGLELEAANRAPNRILVVATATRLSDVDQSLRRAERFDHEIEIPVPNSKSRAAILKTLLGLPPNTPEDLLDGIAERTHGYVGSDLSELVQKAGHEAERRTSQDVKKASSANTKDEAAHSPSLKEVPTPRPTKADFEVALSKTAPTAMREIFLEAPNVHWTDVGGQERVKQALREGVIWQFKYPTRMRELGIQPKKGLLLYGPPGCSKTLTAKALATEAGLNFLAVKGAELLNQYVGESERALREVFRKAKSASPSILFFDEIDAIASARVSGQSSGLQVLTTLLTEMDGFEALAGVTILAATNKPETLDPALMRPGRLDEILYVGPPDLQARQDILEITFRKMRFDSSIDTVTLAEQMDGYSGAEVVNICQKAGYAALRATDATGYDGPITEEHVRHAMSQMKPQITMEVRTRYEQWSAGRDVK